MTRNSKCRYLQAEVAFRLACAACLCDHLLKPKWEATSRLPAALLFGGVKKDALLVDTRANICQNDDVDCEPPPSPQVRGLFPDYDLESSSERVDALNMEEHIFDIVGEIPPEHAKKNKYVNICVKRQKLRLDHQQRVRKQTVDQILNTVAPEASFPVAFCCARAIFETHFSSFVLTYIGVCNRERLNRCSILRFHRLREASSRWCGLSNRSASANKSPMRLCRRFRR